MFRRGKFGTAKMALLEEIDQETPGKPIVPVLTGDFKPEITGNGFVYPELASTDLHLVGDDPSSGADWNSRVGGWVAVHTGSPSVGNETPLYPGGGWAGTGYRKAIGGFSSTQYYKIAYNSAHALTSSSTTTTKILLKTGTIAQEETYYARYITASSKPNFRVYTKNDGSDNYRLYVEVGHSTTNALVNAIVTQSSFQEVVFSYDGASKVLTLTVNGASQTGSGQVATSTGVGTITNDTSTNVWIGITDTTFLKPLVKGQVIEIIRYQEIFSSTTLAQQFQKMAGIVLPGDIYPVAGTFFRNSFAYGIVNNKNWAFGKNWPFINENGFFQCQPFTCSTYNTAITDGNTNVTLTAGVSRAAEPGSFNSQINGEVYSIPLDGTLQSAAWFNFGLASNTKSAMTVVWRGINGAIAYGRIYDETTLKYCDPTTNTWSLTPTEINLSSYVVRGTGTLLDPYVSNVPFITETVYVGTHRIDPIVHNNSAGDPAGIIKIDHCQICNAGQFYALPLVAIHPTGGDSSVHLGTGLDYPSSLVNWTRGRITFSLRPIYSSTQPMLSPANTSSVFSGSTSTAFLTLNINTAVYRFKDATHTVTLSPTFNQYERLDFQLDWAQQAGAMRGQVTNKALSGQAVFTSPLASGNFRFGTSSNSACGFISSLKIYKFA